MIDRIYATVNGALAAAWASIAPGSAFVDLRVDRPGTLPPDSLRLHWLDYGGPTDQVTETRSYLQLDVFVPSRGVPLALQRAAALDAALGFTTAGGFSILGIEDASGAFIAEARLLPDASGWLDVADPVPGIVHLSRQVEIFTTPLIP